MARDIQNAGQGSLDKSRHEKLNLLLCVRLAAQHIGDNWFYGNFSKRYKKRDGDRPRGVAGSRDGVSSSHAGQSAGDGADAIEKSDHRQLIRAQVTCE